MTACGDNGVLQVDLRLRQFGAQHPWTGAGGRRVGANGEGELLDAAGPVADVDAHRMHARLHHLRRDEHGKACQTRVFLVGIGGLKVFAANAVMGAALRDPINEDRDVIDPVPAQRPAGEGQEATHGLDGHTLLANGCIEKEADRRRIDWLSR